MNENTAKWDKCGILKGVPDDFKDDMASALENQRFINESLCGTSEVAQWKRCSIPVVRRLMTELKACGVDIRSDYTRMTAKVLKTDIKPYYMTLEQRFKHWNTLDWECDQTADLTKNIVACIKRNMDLTVGDGQPFYLLGLIKDDDGLLAIYYGHAPVELPKGTF